MARDKSSNSPCRKLVLNESDHQLLKKIEENPYCSFEDLLFFGPTKKLEKRLAQFKKQGLIQYQKNFSQIRINPPEG